MKRVFLFLLTNLAIMLVLSITMSILMQAFGINYRSYAGLLLMAAVFGFGGSFISLQMSKWMAKRMHGLRVISHPMNETELWLMDIVAKQAKETGVAMPEVAIFESQDVNAFATGSSKNNSLVAVSSGLLSTMTQREAEAVVGHEMAHVANGDMVTLTLIQGVVNTFVIFFARVLAGLASNVLNNSDDSDGQPNFFLYHTLSIVFELLFGVLASIVVFYFSRQREYRADQGGAYLAGKENMIAALERLKIRHTEHDLPSEFAAFGINGKQGLVSLFMTHPSIDDRIAALKKKNIDKL